MGSDWPDTLTGSERFIIEKKIEEVQRLFRSLERIIKKLKRGVENLHLACR